MKKNLWMILAMCVMTLPLMANTLEEELCGDETFAAFVSDTERLSKYIEALSPDARMKYLASEEMTCYRETMSQQAIYILTNFSLVQRADREAVLRSAIDKAAKQYKIVLTRDCNFYFMIAWFNCSNMYPLPSDYGMLIACQEAATAAYTLCVGAD
jgi:hypothetical protein